MHQPPPWACPYELLFKQAPERLLTFELRAGPGLTAIPQPEGLLVSRFSLQAPGRDPASSALPFQCCSSSAGMRSLDLSELRPTELRLCLPGDAEIAWPGRLAARGLHKLNLAARQVA